MRLESSGLKFRKFNKDSRTFFNANQANIAIYSEKINVYCFIDKDVVRQVVDSLMLFFDQPSVFIEFDTKSILKNLFSSRKVEVHDVVSVNDK